MPDFAFYWKNFARESKRGDWPCKGWYSSDDGLSKHIAKGDRVWLFASGEACGQAEAKAGYLVEVLVAQKVVRNQGEDRDYPSGEYHYFIVADPAKAFKVDPPLLVDAILRPEGHARDEPISRLLQKPRKLSDDVLGKLKEQLEAERKELARAILGN